MHLLVTGFGPFPSMLRNPSAALAAAIAGAPRLRRIGVRTTCRILTTSYATLPRELDPALAAGPDAVLMIGVAGRSRTVRVERRATSRRSTLFADVAGETAAPHSSAASSARWTACNAVAALRSLRGRGLPARLSRDAGRYLCNAAYVRALAHSAPTLFVHIPKARSGPKRGPRRRTATQERERWRDAMVDLALGLVAGGRRVADRPASR